MHCKKILAAWFVMAPACFAQLAAEIIPIAGAPTPARLVAIRDGTAMFRDGQHHDDAVPVEAIVRWGTLVNSMKSDQLLLVDNSLVMGRVLEISSDTVHVYTDVWGELALSRNVVRGVIWRVPADTRELWRLRDDLQQPHGELDLLKLVNGDQLQGNVLTAGGGQLTFRSAAGDVSLTMDRLQSWRSAHDKMSRDDQQASVIGFRDGTLLMAKSVSLDQQLDVELACGPRLITLPEVRLAEEAIVTYFRPYNSRVVYLSDLETIGHKHVPLLSVNWDWQRDRNVLGGPLSSVHGMHEKGIGMHSTARLAFDLDDAFEEFQAEASLDVTAGRNGSVVFRVFTSSGGGEWSQAFASGIVRGTSSPIAIRVDIRQARRIAIVVDYADDGDVLDRANWIGARLIRAPLANGGT